MAAVNPMSHPWIEPATGARLGHAATLRRMAEARVALLGERHDVAADHRWQGNVIAGLAALRDELVVGFEMFPRRAQPALDAWTEGRSDEAAFLRDSGWQQVWGFDPALYRPIFDLCRELRLPARALNVDRPIVSLVGRDGWGALPEAERAWMTPARPAGAAYRRYLFEVTGGARPDRKAASAEDPAFDRFVRAQQTWDRAFACAIATALADRPGALVVGLIGRGHLEYGHGTPDQLADLGVAPVIVALPGGGRGDDAAIADLLFEPASGAHADTAR
ncbi:ChaN family lipoprotein [uncultured Amaricoccus sp.]|uniref:ChaN family lipoprotein n=1 Tax=uncultured Amaricoccus sp. TaxID=339341 RepID=UPI00261D22BF|nr:ChaN family lipoprotein [uncultured Amaricoccus sp.]